jgi:S1-C subfamily serine protease
MSLAIVGLLARCLPAASGEAPPVPETDADYLDASDTLDISGLQEHFEAISKTVSPSVVAISATISDDSSGDDVQASDEMNPEKLQSILDRNTRTVGTGFIIDSDGFILTNQHVIESAQEIWVTTDNRKVWPAVVIGSDPRADLAVLRIPAKNLPAVQFAAKDQFHRGQWTIALGNPYGMSVDGQLCMSVGVISATDRALPRLSMKEDRLYSHLLQTTAQINPGNSGGPLLDIAGHVIGINTAVILPQKQTNGIGFAIPVTSHLVSEVNDLKQGREIVYGYLGVSVTEPTAHERIAAGAAEDVGVRVDEAEPNSPAAAAGIEMGDLIVKYNDQPIDGSDQFVRLVGESPVGKAVAVDLFRNGKPMTLMTTPRRRTMETLAITHDSERVHWRGMLLGPIPADWRNSPNKPAKGLVVFGIDDKSPMKSQGISLGSVITTIGGRDVSSVVDLLSVINETPVEKCNVQAVTPTTQPAKLTAVTASHNAQQ